MPLRRPAIHSITFSVDGGGQAITTGTKVRIAVPYDAIINDNTVIADTSGNITFDIKKSTYSGYPTTSSICASAKPALSSAQKSQDTSLSGWTTTIDAGDILELVVEGTPTVNWASLVLSVTKV